MRNPPKPLLQAIYRSLGTKHTSTRGPGGGSPHEALFHDGAPSVLYPPIIPALANQGGIGKQRWETGVVDIVIPLYDFFALGDNVVLYVDDTYVDAKTVHDTSAQLVFAAPVRAFKPSPQVPGYEADVHFHTTDQLGFNETASRSTRLPVKLTVPGNPREDLPADTVVNERLAAPVGVPAHITPLPGNDLPLLVPPYPYMAAGDVITLFWAGAGVPHPPLTADQVDSDITVVVPSALIAAWPGPAREVRYSIIDRVKNFSLFSPSAYSDVTEQGTLVAPRLIGQIGDAFNPDSLAGGAALIDVPDIDLLTGDQVTVHFIGQPLQWTYLHHVTEAQSFTGASLTFSVPNPLARSLVGSTLNLHYQAQRAGATLRSLPSVVQIVGTTLALPAPYLPTAENGAVAPPEDATDLEIIVLANIGFAPGSQVELRWLGVDGGGNEHTHSLIKPALDPAMAMVFRAPLAWLNAIEGGTLRVAYNLLAGEQAYPSDALHLSVGGNASLLPEPTFVPALDADDQLDLGTLSGAFLATVTVDNPAFTDGAARLAWTGSSAADVIVVDPIPPGPTTLHFPIDRARLLEPNLDQHVAVNYQIQRPDGVLARSRTRVMSVINSDSLRWPKAQVLDHSGQPVSALAPVREISAGGWTENTATVRVTDSRLQAGDTVDVFWMLASGFYPAIPRATAQAGQAQVTVPGPVLAESFGTRVTITYLATVCGQPALLGEELELLVASPPTVAFGAPEVIESTAGHTLDLNTFSGAATVRVPAYPFMAVGQTFWLWMYSRRDDGSQWSMRLGNPPFIVTQADVSSGYLQRSVDRALLLRLEDQADITLTLKAGLSGSADEQKAFDFNSAELRFSQLRLGLQPALIERLADDGSVEIHGTSGTLKITARYTPVAGQLIQAVWQPPGTQPPVLLPTIARPMPGSLAFEMPNELAAQYDTQTVHISYRVARTEGASWESSVPVAVKVMALPDAQTEDFSTETPRSIRPGTTETLRFFSVYARGQTTYLQHNDLESSLLKGMVLRTFASSGWTFTLHRPAVRITFDLDASSAGDIQVIYALANGQNVQQTYRTPLHIVFADPTGSQHIASVSFQAGSYSNLYIDNITLDYF
jgi:hypothetical protein